MPKILGTPRKVGKKKPATPYDRPEPKKKFVNITMSGVEIASVEVSGRPDFNSGALAIDLESDEHRRHMSHWDETLKPFLNHSLTAITNKYRDPSSILNALKTPLMRRNIVPSPENVKDVESITKYIAKMANSCQFARKSVPPFALKVSPLGAGVCSRPAA